MFHTKKKQKHMKFSDYIRKAIVCLEDGIELEKKAIARHISLDGGVWWRGYHAIWRIKKWDKLDDTPRKEIIRILENRMQEYKEIYFRKTGKGYISSR